MMMQAIAGPRLHHSFSHCSLNLIRSSPILGGMNRVTLLLLCGLETACCSQRVAALEMTEGTHEGRPQFIVRTESATWYFDRAGGGFSRLIDRDGNDWIAFSKTPLKQFPGSAAAGYRGMPNAVFGGDNPDAGAGHPGFDQCESELIGDHTIRTTSRSGKWAWTWTFTETTATMTMETADPAHPWWFLYEGPVAGSFDPKNKFWGTSHGGPRADIPDNQHPFFDRFQWIYFGDRDTPRVLWIAQHEPDDLDDTVWYLGSSEGGAATAPDGMMVFGFGRGKGTKPLFRGAGRQFTVGLLEVEGSAETSGLHRVVEAHVQKQVRAE